MKIISYQDDAAYRKQILDYLDKCPWVAGKVLSDLLKGGNFFQKNDKAFFLLIDERIVSFLTLAEEDCVKDQDKRPWIGFVYTNDEDRKKGYMRNLMRFALDAAKRRGDKCVYLATNHVGLYERLGFTYLCNMIDIYGDDSRIYTYTL